MVFNTNRRYRTRLVSDTSGVKRYATACGYSRCDGTRFDARLISNTAGVKRYAMASDGCQLPLDLAAGLTSLDETCVTKAQVRAAAALRPFMVEKANFPPYGLSRVLRAELHGADGCADKDCVGAYLLYHDPGELTAPAPCSNSASHGVWQGCFAAPDGTSLPVHVYYEPAAPPGLELHACVGGDNYPATHCRAATEAVIAAIGCGLGGSGLVTSPLPASSCCVCPGGQLSLTIRSFCGPYRMARLVGFPGGVPRYATATCADPPACTPASDCCAAIATCALTLEIEVQGECCADLSGTYTLTPSGTAGHWSTFPTGPINACDLSWTFFLDCVGGELVLRADVSIPGATCSGSDGVTLAAPCWPLLETFSLVVGCSFGVGGPHEGHCNPVSITATVSS